MADYQKMYLTAVDAMERAMAILEEAERACEAVYMETAGGEESEVLLFPQGKSK